MKLSFKKALEINHVIASTNLAKYFKLLRSKDVSYL